MKGLAAHKPKETFQLAVNLFDADDDPRVRRVAIETLAAYKNEAAAAALIEGAAAIPVPEQRRVVQALSGFDEQVLATESCDLVDQEAQLIARAMKAMRTGASVSPAAAEQLLPGLESYRDRIPTLREAFKC